MKYDVSCPRCKEVSQFEEALLDLADSVTCPSCDFKIGKAISQGEEQEIKEGLAQMRRERGLVWED